VNCVSQWDRRERIALVKNTALKLTLDESMKSLHSQRCVQVAFIPLILGCYFSTLDRHPLSNMLICVILITLQITGTLNSWNEVFSV